MNDGGGVTASSLAITTDKRPRKAGGCVGIFFQLFDWNRRFAKKKLFSTKLLPPARGKQGFNKFGRDEKLPKLRLIADENSGGFPNLKKNGASTSDSEHKNGVRTPGLVARLMGLESMPNVGQVKSKKGSFVDNRGGVKKDKFGSDDCEAGIDIDPCLEKGTTKNEFRPQKLQKTGLLEKHQVTRFGAEALQLKNVLSRSRKHHAKLATPVKSPRNHAGRNASRLTGAATKILERGLQAKNRAKCALTYTDHGRRAPPRSEYVPESTKSVSASSESSSCYMGAAKLLNGQSSCRNCGNLLDVVDSRSNINDQPPVFVSPVSDYVNRSPQVSERSSPTFTKQEINGIVHMRQEHSASLTTRGEGDRVMEMMPLDQGGQLQWPLRSQKLRPQNFTSSCHFMDETHRQTESPLFQERYPSQAKLSHLQANKTTSSANSVSEVKDFIALNRSLTGQARPRIPGKVDDVKFEKERKLYNRRNNSFCPGQRRRSMDMSGPSGQVDCSGLAASTFDKPRTVSSIASNGKDMRRHARSTNKCNRNRLAHPGESNKIHGSENKDSDAVAFTFTSPMKHRNGTPTKVDRRRENSSPSRSTPHKSSMVKASHEKTSTQKPLPLTGDVLGALLEQKLKELTSQEADESVIGGVQPKRTSAKIFEELIDALNAERTLCQTDLDCTPPGRSSPHLNDHVSDSNVNFRFQAKPKRAGASVGYSHNIDHLSPGSVLEASFSNDSCCSSSMEDSSGLMVCADSSCCSYDEPQPFDPESDVYASGTSFTKEKTGKELVIDLHNYITGVLCSINLCNDTLKSHKLNHAKEVILSTELLLGNAACHTNDISTFSVSHFLLDELETLANVMWTNFSNILGFKDTKEGNQLQVFLFDCLIEYLDLKYCQYAESGFRSWRKLLSCMNAEILTHELVEEVKRWMGFVGWIRDELIEKEMSYCLGKWTDFEIEAYESGVEIDRDILQCLVDEVVIDLITGF